MKDEERIVVCPDCGSRLTIDPETGEVLLSEPIQRTASVSFEDRIRELERQKVLSDKIFNQQMDALKDRERLLEEKFKKALEATKDMDDSRPIREIDLD